MRITFATLALFSNGFIIYVFAKFRNLQRIGGLYFMTVLATVDLLTNIATLNYATCVEKTTEYKQSYIFLPAATTGMKSQWWDVRRQFLLACACCSSVLSWR